MSINKKYLSEAPDWVAPEDRLSFTESFSQWLDQNNDALPEPESFSDWLNQNDDSVKGGTDAPHGQ